MKTRTGIKLGQEPETKQNRVRKNKERKKENRERCRRAREGKVIFLFGIHSKDHKEKFFNL